MMDIANAYRLFDIPMRRYIIAVVLPVLMSALVIPPVLSFLFPHLLLSVVLLATSVLWILFIYVLLLPIIQWQKRARMIDEDMHLFITRMGVLASQEIPRWTFVELLHELGEYESMKREVNRIFHLVKEWRLPLSHAARIVAKESPSKLFSDFLDRFAFSIDGGESERDFFLNEQAVVLDEYEIRYESSLKEMEIFKELFIAMIIAAIFIIVVVAFMPLLTGQSATTLMALAIFLFILVEVGFLYIVHSTMPMERIWHTTKIWTKTQSQMVRATLVGIVGCLTTAGVFVCLNYTTLGRVVGIMKPEMVPVLIATVLTPLVIPGYYVLREEEKVRRREDHFPAFIRSLGGTAETKSIAAVTAMKKLSLHDFGPLTENIVRLTRRLSTGIDARRSWRYFGAETGSDLITKFSEMYVEGFRVGGRPRTISAIISANFVRVLGLRKKRYQAASDMAGVMYGVLIAISFTLYIMMGLLNRVQKLYADITAPSGYEAVKVLRYATFSIPFMNVLIICLIVAHALISSLLLRIMSGGHKLGSLFHFVLLVWVGAIFSIIVGVLLSFLLPSL